MHPYRRILDRLFRSLPLGTLTVEYWDGASSTYGSGEPRVTIRLKTPGVVPGLLFNPEMAVGEAYMRGDLEIEGRMEDFMVVTALDDPHPSLPQRLLDLAARLAIKPLSLVRHRRDVSRHYDLGNDFYRLWLDPTMSYSCAYFQAPDETLETAQRRKIAHTLKKLCPKPGETLLDIGCGWGAVVREAAQTYGVDALGITLSDQQVAWFHEQPSLNGDEGTAQVALKHYHTLAQEGRTFDKIVTIGMAEHVGKRNLPGFHRDLKRLLKPGGLCLHHCITYLDEAPTNPWLLKYIFPGGYIPSFREVVNGLTHQGLTVWDVENIGPHYALTLDRWGDAFDQNAAWVEDRYGAEFVWMWRLYLRYCAASFRVEDVFVHQVLVSNGRPRELPLTREHLCGEGVSRSELE
jgi:cyclopropane-fatty-acyl-phospholipid synthase